MVAPLPDADVLPEMLHCGATMLKANVLVDPPPAAVRVAVWLAETAPTVAENVPLEAPAETESVEGTAAAEFWLASATLNPPARAGLLRVTVQVAEPGALTVAGEQERLLTAGDTGTVIPIVPPAPVPAMGSPLEVDADTAVI
jgi:hypothetical protein